MTQICINKGKFQPHIIHETETFQTTLVLVASATDIALVTQSDSCLYNDF